MKGVENYKDYTITVRLFESAESEDPVDTLTQVIRSYVENTDGVVRKFEKLNEQ